MNRRITSCVLALAVALSVLVGFSAVSTSSAYAAKDLDCANFPNQGAAQRNLNANPSDPNGLDSEGDGVACESLPCPCLGKAPAPTKPTPAPNPNPQPRPEGDRTVVQDARVIRVIDGDTVEVRLLTGAKATVRILGIDTPEVFGGQECYGPEASTYAKKKLPRNTRVTLTSDPTQDLKDRYGRILRYLVKKSTKTDIGKLQLKKGNATVYVFQNNPFNKTKPYRNAENQAQDAQRGLWGACDTSGSVS